MIQKNPPMSRSCKSRGEHYFEVTICVCPAWVGFFLYVYKRFVYLRRDLLKRGFSAKANILPAAYGLVGLTKRATTVTPRHRTFIIIIIGTRKKAIVKKVMFCALRRYFQLLVEQMS